MTDGGDEPPRRPTRKLDEGWDQSPALEGEWEKRPAEVAGTIEGRPAQTIETPAIADEPAPPPPAPNVVVDVPTQPTGPSGLAYPAYQPPPPPADEPLLPSSYSENELRAAVGATPRSDVTPLPRRHTELDDDDDDEPRAAGGNRKSVLVIATSLIVGLAITGLVILGRVNSDRYVLTCEADRAIAEQGRAFPPWGTHALGGEQWKPIKLTPEADCKRQEPESQIALEGVFLTMLIDRATALLANRTGAPDPDAPKIDEAEAMLKQALLLARVPEGAPADVANDRHDRKGQIERLLGDVTYWRASAKLHDAATALGDAAKQFDAAAAQRPQHASDAASRAAYARKLLDELGGTQAPVAAQPVTPNERPTAPVGTALPVEPAPAPAEPPPPAPDAGVPSGGVLL